MDSSSELRHGRHCVFTMHVHLVFVTKYRRHVFTREILDDLRLIFTRVCTDFEAELVEFDGEDDHVHLLVNYPPKVAVSRLMNSLKGASSRVIRKKNYPSMAEIMGWRFMVTLLLRWKLWRRSYCRHPTIHRATANSALTQ